MRTIFTTFLRTMLFASFALAFCVLTHSTAHAQFNANLQGTVTDPSNAVISGATVTLINTETSREQQTTTNDEGFYRFSQLAPGNYNVAVEQTGFQRTVLDNILINAEGTQGIDVQLTTGGVTETVTITGTAQGLETENANISKPITTEEIRRLPQAGRDPYELLRLAPGVFGNAARGSGTGGAVEIPNVSGPGGSDASVFQVENQPQISANGQRVSANNIQIDGVSVNSLTNGGAAVVTPNQESVKEVRVLSSTYSAEDGRNSGAQIKVVSQNGTNEFHGSAVFKYNSPGLNAFNKYGNFGGAPTRVEQNFRQYGGSLGGPIYLPRFGEGGPAFISGKDRLFFFFSYEGARNNNRISRATFVETPEFRNYVRTVRPNSLAARLFNTPGIAPTVVNVIPVPCSVLNQGTTCQQLTGGLDIGSINPDIAPGRPVGFDRDGGGLDGIPDIQFAQLSIPNQLRGNQYNTRIDYNGGNNQFAVSTYFTKRNDIQGDFQSAGRSTGALTFRPLNSAVTLTYNRVLSATTLNEARLNFTRFSYNQLASSSDTNFGIPLIKVEGLGTNAGLFPGQGTSNDIFFGPPRSPTTPGIFAQNQFEFRDVLSTLFGNHALKIGGEYRREQDNNNLGGDSRPEFGFFTLFGFANDAPIFENRTFDPRTGGPADLQRYFRSNTYGAFIQDDWKYRPNLTLNLGLRYEYFSPLTEKRGRLSNFIFGPAGSELAGGRVEVVDRIHEPDRNNFAPRLGFAYSPTRFRESLVLRGGFGISYNRSPGVVFSNAAGNPPFVFRNNFVCCAFTEGDTFALERISYSFGSSNSPFSYPEVSAVRLGINPATGGLNGLQTEVYGSQPNLPNAYVYSYSFEGQYELPSNLIASIGYQGSSSHKLIRTVNQNFLYDADNPSFFAIYFPLPDVNANFNALNARLSKRFAQGFQFDANYRFSKSIDTLSYEFGADANQTNPRDLASERGPSDFDVKHALTISSLYELPFFRDRQGFVGKALGGFLINGILTAHTGFPWTPKVGTDLNGDGVQPDRPTRYFGGAIDSPSVEDFTRPGGIFPGITAPGGVARYFDITTPGGPGIGRNSFRGPRYFSVDLSLAKQFGVPTAFRLGEAANLDLRANLFNIFNTLNLTPFRFNGDNTKINDFRFGRAEDGLAGRVVEFQARFSF